MRRAGRRALQATVIAATLLFAAPAVAGESLDVAWLRGGVAEYIRLVGPAPGEILAAPPAATPLDRRLETSLGSIWKLFVYVYLSERDLAAPDYTCDGSAPKDEAFCCAPGSTVGVDQALACSCGLFFAPSRLNVTAEDWRVFWGGRTLPRDAAWLLDLSRVVPDTRVSVASLLAALAAVPPRGRQRAERALLDVVVAAQPLPARHLGATLRVKTWTWDDPTRAGTHAGGFAGWLADGTPVWARGEGGGMQVLQRWAPALARHFADVRPPDESECVSVDFFARYPIRQVVERASGVPATAGLLDGTYRVEFQNGRSLDVTSRGTLRLARDTGAPTLSARLGLNDYVARVLDREAAARPMEAARALATAARTWLVQNANRRQGCWHIADDSRAQRVSPNPPSEAARRVAGWTDGLVVAGAPVTYHRSQGSRNTLAWIDAVELAASGVAFDQILAAAYPDGRLATLHGAGRAGCERLGAVERWLAERAGGWRPRLHAEGGFEPPPRPVAACRLAHGRPFADAENNRIHVRGIATTDDRITVVHEYLHLAFRFHPRGLDEDFVERLARELAREP
ncbi:MAG: DUF2300 domain-containing protein [Candidatus Rokuibacteriota bacterium]|nr:MAG: DUF2300 domain-containing protein [Candidatus Rokubacteria bacterium]